MDRTGAKSHLALYAWSNFDAGARRMRRLSASGAKIARAMRAAGRFDRNRHGACRTILCHRWRRWMRPLQPVESSHQKKDRESNNDKVDRERDEVSIVPSDRPGLYGVRRCGEKPSTGWMFENQEFVRKIEPTCDQSD